jgi:hypothetical protein
VLNAVIDNCQCKMPSELALIAINIVNNIVTMRYKDILMLGGIEVEAYTPTIVYKTEIKRQALIYDIGHGGYVKST